MPDVVFREVQAEKFTDVVGSPRELYDQLVENGKAKGSYEQFLYKIGTKLFQNPTMVMRFHLITDEGEHIRFSVKSVRVAEEISKNLGDEADSAFKNRKSWREFRRIRRRMSRRFG